MLLAISIRNPEVEVLARKVSEADGCSMTEAILHSLQERYRERENGQMVRLERLKAIASRSSDLPDLDTRSVDEILGYNESGLP